MLLRYQRMSEENREEDAVRDEEAHKEHGNEAG